MSPESGIFPTNSYQPLVIAPYQHDPNATYPSAYAEGGYVSWNNLTTNGDGKIDVTFTNARRACTLLLFPTYQGSDLRWSRLRETEGWGALQHHALLRSTIIVFPPSSSARCDSRTIPYLLVDLRQGSFFAILPTTGENHVPEWHAGNIYDVPGPSKSAVELPFLSLDSPTTYDVFISADYEV